MRMLPTRYFDDGRLLTGVLGLPLDGEVDVVTDPQRPFCANWPDSTLQNLGGRRTRTLGSSTVANSREDRSGQGS